MREEDPAIAHLRAMVDQAHSDVRRAESTGPAMLLGAVLACLPLALVLAVFVGGLLW
jgi:hypothetical protein